MQFRLDRFVNANAVTTAAKLPPIGAIATAVNIPSGHEIVIVNIAPERALNTIGIK